MVSVLVLLLGGGAPRVVPSLPSASPVVLWLLALMPLAHLVLGTATVACAVLASGWLAPATGRVRPFATAWAGIAVLTLLLQGLQLRGIGVPTAQLPSSPQATGVFLGLLVVGFLAYAAPTAPEASPALAVLGLLPPLLTGHVRTAAAPWLAGTSLSLHVAAAATWVGGLAAVGWLVLRQRPGWAQAPARFSPVAGWAVLVVAVSGEVTALTRIRTFDDLGTGYGTVVLVKVACLLVLVALGALHRRRLRRAQPTDGAGFVRLAGVELVLMVVTFAVATALADTPPPV
jgi:putative copper resistance protein D